MIVVFINTVVVALTLRIFRQDNIWDIFPLIIIAFVTLLISEVGMNSTVDNVKRELETKFPNKKFNDYQVDFEFIPDITLSIFGFVYYLLIAFFVYELYMGILNHNIFFRLLLPLALLIIYDIIFASMYCYKQVVNKSNVWSFVIYHESRFIHKGIFFVIVVMGILVCAPFLIFAVIMIVLEFFL